MNETTMNTWNLPARVLLIEDDEEDYLLIRNALLSFSSPRFELDWTMNFDAALDAIANGNYDACLLDYRLGEHNGLELLEAVGSTCRMPIIFLTGQEDYTVDFQAMRAGAVDYLVKDHINAPLLERSIRYAMDRKQKEEELRRFAREQERLNQELSRTLQELQVAEEKLRSSNEELIESQTLAAFESQRYRDLFDFAPDGYFITDEHGAIVGANRAAAALLGVDQNRLKGIPLVIYVEDKRAFYSLLSGVKRRKAIRDFELGIQPPGGEAVHVSASVVTVSSLPDGEVGLRWLLRDITMRKQTERELHRYREHLESLVEERTRELQQAKKEAESSNRAKSEFMANMSHEIRTPIGCILGTTDMALSLDPDEAQKECLLTIKDVTDSLMKIINDILDLSKIEAGRMEIVQEAFDLHSLLSNTVNPLRSQAERKGIELFCKIDPEVPSLLIGDPAGLRQILVNLIGNGLKFTERGEVNVKVEGIKRVEEGETDSGLPLKLLFSVNDTGIGIPEDKQKLIFDPFKQADGTLSKKYGGTGLGLAICKNLIEMMHGEIGVESKEGEGATFHFTAVFQEASGCTALSEESSKTDEIPSEGRSLFILLAEDNLMNQKFLRHWLESEGHTVITAKNGREALAALEKISFDLVLMDIQMPEMNGLEATRIIRSSESEFIDPEIPVIALTAYAMKGDRERMLEAGMDGYVPKPLEFKELLRVMNEVIYKKTKVIHLPDAPCETVNLRDLKSADEGTIKLFKELIGDFESSLPQRMRSLKDALEAKDLESVMRIAHALAGVIGIFQAPKSVKCARRLEEAARNADLDRAISFSAQLGKELHSLLTILIKESESI